jgi:sRNA-binding protein
MTDADVTTNLETPKRKRAVADARVAIAALCDLFPALFVAELWQPHKPLKIGIHQELVDRGVLQPGEVRDVFRQYCSRLMYQRSVAAGGPRYDLDGKPCGEVSADQVEAAIAAIAHIEARRAAQAATARAAAKTVQPCRGSSTPSTSSIRSPSSPTVNSKHAPTSIGSQSPTAVEMPTGVPAAARGVATNAPRRLSLSDLKAAAAARREAAQEAGADYPHLT